MSLILDALRRRSSDQQQRDEVGRNARTDAVLAMLGYPRQRRGKVPPVTLLLYGVAALAAGFVGLWAVLAVLTSPPRRPVQPAGQVARSSPPPAAPAAQVPLHAAQTPLETPSPPPDAAQQADRQLETRQVPTGELEPTTRSRPSQLRVPASPVPVIQEAVAPPGAPVLKPSPAPGPANEPLPRRAPRPMPTPTPAPTPTPSPTAPAPVPTDHFGLAVYYQRVGDFENALAQYRVLLEQNDASAEVHNNLGLLYQDRGQVDEAIKHFQRAIVIEPKYVKAHNNLGVALMRIGQMDQAAAEFRVALVADGRNVESMVNLALVQKAAGRGAEARDLLRRAVAIDPRNPGSHYNLAVVADEGGDRATAIEHYRAFLKLGSVAHGGLATQVRTRLASLGPG